MAEGVGGRRRLCCDDLHSAGGASSRLLRAGNGGQGDFLRTGRGWVIRSFDLGQARKCAWIAEAMAVPRGMGTALPICRAMSVFEPHQRKSRGNPCMRAAS